MHYKISQEKCKKGAVLLRDITKRFFKITWISLKNYSPGMADSVAFRDRIYPEA